MGRNVPERECHSFGPRADNHTQSAKSRKGSTNPEEDVQSVVGVSISRTQTRLRSPVFYDGSAAFLDPSPSLKQNDVSQSGLDYDGSLRHASKASSPEDSEVSASSDETPLPSPWTSEPKSFEEHRIGPQQQIAQDPRPSPTPGTMGTLVDSNLKRLLSTLTMPSLPKPPSMRDISMPTLSTFMGHKGNLQVDGPAGRQKRANSLMPQRPQWLSPRIATTPQQRPPNGRTLATNRAGSVNHVADPDSPSFVTDISFNQAAKDRGAPSPSLKRSISDQSLAIRRASSLGSSLGDDTQWENVQKVVNSRTKAIADSLQDSNIRLPSLPSVNFGSLRPDFLRGRAASDTSRSPQLNRWSGSFPAAFHSSPHYQNGNLQANLRPQKIAVDSLQASKTSPKAVNPHFTQALESLTGDIVIMGGYRGSILRSAKPPHRQLWVPVKVGLNMRKVNLEVGLKFEDEERMEETIFSSGMLSHIGPVDMGRRLLKRLRSCRNAQEGKLKVHDYGYDWRLSPHLLSRRLIRYLENLLSNTDTSKGGERGAIVIAHSLGGLITRHAVNQRPELFAGVIYAGVPQHCINILGPMRNGDEVLLSSKVLTAQVNFTLRTSYLLLPDDGRCFVDKLTKEDYLVNFMDIAEWRRHALSPCIAPALPPFVAPERKGLLNSMADNLMALPLVGRKSLPTKPSTKTEASTVTTAAMADVEPQLDDTALSSSPSKESQSTIPLAQAEEYLARTLASTVCFRDEFKFDALHAQENRYPPLSILYGTSVPTVYRARIAARAAIRCKDAFEDLAFASGDGVCLAKAAMLPAGYKCTPGGKVKTERGHVGLLGDLEAIGKCLVSVIEGRKKGVGLGPQSGECRTR
ncbi:MAG: hypothetical protein L6R38_005992 [Xanthoria sp. 2 TBL-2021]|nr:MAG: hypothetical protein L6R38_005992 [Xanthoria sp. 2 TBL-2021]